MAVNRLSILCKRQAMKLGRKCNHHGNLELKLNEYNVSEKSLRNVTSFPNSTASPLSPSKTEAYSEMDCPWPYKHMHKHFIKLDQGFIL